MTILFSFNLESGKLRFFRLCLLQTKVSDHTQMSSTGMVYPLSTISTNRRRRSSSGGWEGEGGAIYFLNIFNIFIFIFFWKKNPIPLKVEKDSTKSPLWLFEESFMVLVGICHGSARNPSWVCKKPVTGRDLLLLLLAIYRQDGLLSEPWNTHLRPLTDIW